MPAAHVKPPLCAGNTTVVLTGLIMGARVQHLRRRGRSSAMAESPVDGTYDFLVPPLVGGTTITAIQELCGEMERAGRRRARRPAPSSLPTPKVHEPLFECGAAVRVSNLHVGGARLCVSRACSAPRSASGRPTPPRSTCPVAPLLITRRQDLRGAAGLRPRQLAIRRRDRRRDRAPAAAERPRAALLLQRRVHGRRRRARARGSTST